MKLWQLFELQQSQHVYIRYSWKNHKLKLLLTSAWNRSY